jgi:hypothetical protein
LIRKKIKYTFIYKNKKNNNLYYINLKSELIDISINRSRDKVYNYVNENNEKNLLHNIDYYETKVLSMGGEILKYK